MSTENNSVFGYSKMKRGKQMKPPKLTADFPDANLFCYECGKEQHTLLWLEELGEYLCRDCFQDSVALINHAKIMEDFQPDLNSYLGGRSLKK